MDPYEFEELVAEIWKLQGYQTLVRKGSGDRGIDIEAKKQEPFTQKILIQAKCYAQENKIGSNDIRKYSTLYQQVSDADSVVIVSTSQFTSEAECLAKDLKVKLIGGDALAGLVEEHIHTLDAFTPKCVENIQESILKAKTTAKILSDRIDSENRELYEKIEHIYKNAPEAKSFKWPVDKLGKRWISNAHYLSVQYQNLNHILLQYAISFKKERIAKLKIIIMLGRGIEYSDVEMRLSQLETKYGCEVIEGESMPGIAVLFNELAENHNLRTVIEIISYISENVFENPDQKPDFKFSNVENQISLLCPECGNMADDNALFCQHCGFDIENDKVKI